MMRLAPAASAAPAALRWINAPGSARVLNVLERACNLVNADGDVLTLLAGGVGMNPFGVSLDWRVASPFKGVTQIGPVSVGAAGLSVGELRISLDTARPWNPLPDWGALRGVIPARRAVLCELGRRAVTTAPPGSLLGLFGPPIIEAAGCDRRVLERARIHGHELARGMAARNQESAVAGARGLAGLGGGLTPAGDDFILGVLLAAWAGLLGPGAEAMCPAIAEAAAPRTTLLSAAYLRAAARGECLEKWHTLLACLREPDMRGAEDALRGLVSIGHTSGADALAGFLAAAAL